MNWSVLAFLLSTALATQNPISRLVRQDFSDPASAQVTIHVREVIAPNLPTKAPAILLIHGARVPGVASFDLDVPGGSLAADLAERGLAVYVMDVLGYGGSTRPKEMDE